MPSIFQIKILPFYKQHITWNKYVEISSQIVIQHHNFQDQRLWFVKFMSIVQHIKLNVTLATRNVILKEKENFLLDTAIPV